MNYGRAKLKITILLIVGGLLFAVPYTFANLPFKNIEWPKDDRSHVDDPKIVTEWWYYTGKLTATNNEKIKHFAYYATLRYMRNQMGKVPTLDVQLTDIDEKKVYGGSILLTDAVMSSETLNISSTQCLLKRSDHQYTLQLTMPTSSGNISFDFNLRPKKKPLLIGIKHSERGLIDMGNNTQSYYYSITRLQTEGVIYIGSKKYEINPDISLSSSWMDHQWGDFSITDVLKSNPWIWMGMQLSDGTDINVGEFIDPNTGQPKGEAWANISMANSRSTYAQAVITPGKDLEKGYPLSYTLQIEDKFYRLKSIVPSQNKNDVWMGIMSINDMSVFEPNAPFAIVENTLMSKTK